MNTPIFLKEQDNFYKDLKADIEKYFKTKQISHRANNQLLIKICLMFLVYLVTYTAIFFVNQTSIFFLAYIFLGAWSVILGLNVGHDAAHNAIFEKRKHNQLALYVFELLGTSSYNWKNRHLGAHHLFPNVMNQDSDIQQSNLVKIFPKDNHKSVHDYQHLYMPLLYLFYIFRWVVYRDFKDVCSKNIGAFNNSKYPRRELFKMIFSKGFYFTYIILLPVYFTNFTFLTCLFAFFLLTVSGSLVITMVLLSTHVGEDAFFPEPDENDVMPHSWSYHQLSTASDFGTESRVLNLLFGGFNHHVIHHLFPYICHIHYPQLTSILRVRAKQYNLPYRHKKYLIVAMLSHFKLLQQNGQNTMSQLSTPNKVYANR
jgi:linoleoyl-CoA desaturase